MKKYIHYCWFGNNKKPKLLKKCLKSWKKFLPEYEIMEWNEENFDINITKFSKQAYEAKKWAFVSDVARIFALKEYGGIYLDTDMIIQKNIDDIIEKAEVFAGWESKYNVAVGILGAKNPNNKLINKIWDFYCNNEFSVENAYALSIPTLLTRILREDYNLENKWTKNQTLKEGIDIYAREYFYPISSDNIENLFTENTRTLHYYIGSWLSESEKKRIKFQLVFGKKLGNLILDTLVFCKKILKKIIKTILYPIVIFRRKKIEKNALENTKNNFSEQFDKVKGKYVVFCNKNWLGTSIATKELFENVIGIEEIWNDEYLKYITDYIIEKKIKLVIFSAFSFGWDKLCENLRKADPNICIKIIWHGSMAMNTEYYDWTMFEKIFELHDSKIINSIGFVKKSQYDFFSQKGYNCEFVANTVKIDVKTKQTKSDNEKIKIGLYASGDRWVKNFYNQLAAASLFKNASIDCIPINEKSLKMARIYHVNLNGLNATIPREKLLERISKNDIIFYTTFSECAPMLPLESMELGVLCITSDNHHYWENTELEKYLIVSKNDNPVKIYEQAKYCLEHKNEIMKLYKEWKKDYDKLSASSVKNFLEIANKK